MAKVTEKIARKDYPSFGIKKGDKYYEWALFRQPVQKSLTPPKRSQLTSSAYLRELYSLQERQQEMTIDNLKDGGLGSFISDIESLRDQQQESLDNMPEGLQQGDSGQLLESRSESLDQWISDLEALEGDIEEIETLEGEIDALDKESPEREEKEQELQEKIEDVISRFQESSADE